MSGLEAAISMYHREHDRWYQWSLFFFGSIAAVFALWGQLNGKVGLWAPSAISCGLSFIWVMVSLNIRASTWAWRETEALELLPNKGGPAFNIFGEKLKEFRRSYDLKNTLTKWREESLLSVTRVLTLLGVFAGIVFAVLFVVSVSGLL